MSARCNAGRAMMEPTDPKLDADHRRHAQSRAKYAGSGGTIINPAFRFDRHTCFPAPTWQRSATARSGGAWAREERTKGRSHPEPRAASRAWRGWRAPDRPVVSTVASSASVGGPLKAERADWNKIT